MVVVAGIWEQGWFDFQTELNLWQFPMRELGVDEIAMVPAISGLNNKVREFHSVDELVQHYGLPIIVGTENGESSLQDFKHPKDALYLFNRTSGGELSVKPDYTLRVETHLNKGLLWGHQAASIILYDRLKKWQ
tara:strand:- start:1394 stop:1795 length:402 start_codon:yes stop_codon:yes gene_type:complete